MRVFQYYIADVFTNQRFGGNQLAVFPDAREIPDDALQRIAREFNFSETTFVLPPSNPAHTRRVRIFTPASELPFAGHPTIGTAFVLATIGDITLRGSETPIVFEEGVGPVPVTIRADKGKTDFAQLSVARMPEVGPPPPDVAALARALGLETADIGTERFVPEALSCGLPYLMVPLRDRAALARARVRLDEFERVFANYWTPDVFLFCDDPELPGSHFRARMFAPMLGVPEDPATGSAAVDLAGYLGMRDPRPDGTLRWRIEQGFEMGRPSLLDIEVDKRAGKITGVRVGGNSVLVSKGEFYL
jgi:trans-2,3-dihydro-3-hydroxyanthranilate isomerase